MYTQSLDQQPVAPVQDDDPELLARFQARGSKKRELARLAMEEAGLKKVSAPDFTLSLRPANPAVVVVEENAIPEAYWVPQPARLDKRNLLEDLKRGADVAGVELSNPPLSLTVRTQ